MNTNETQKTRPTGFMSVPAIPVAILVVLLMSGAAQAWWIRTGHLVWRGGW